MVIELQGDADDLMAGLVQEPGDDTAIHPAGHGDHDTQTALPIGRPQEVCAAPAGCTSTPTFNVV